MTKRKKLKKVRKTLGYFDNFVEPPHCEVPFLDPTPPDPITVWVLRAVWAAAITVMSLAVYSAL